MSEIKYDLDEFAEFYLALSEIVNDLTEIGKSSEALSQNNFYVNGAAKKTVGHFDKEPGKLTDLITHYARACRLIVATLEAVKADEEAFKSAIANCKEVVRHDRCQK